MLESVNTSATAPRPDAQRVFETLGLNKSEAAGISGVVGSAKASRPDNALRADRQAENAPPPSQTGGVDAKSLVEGLLEASDIEVAQNSTLAAQSLYTETQGLLTGTA